MNLWNTLGVTPLGGILIAAGGIAAAVTLAVARLRRAGSFVAAEARPRPLVDSSGQNQVFAR
jgi:hypothetical protein